MSIAAGSIVTVMGRSVVDRLQDAGLQNPTVPVTTVRETGNDLVVGKVLTEADFNFQMTSWDVSCDLLAMLNGQLGSLDPLTPAGPSAADPAGTVYRWDTVQCVNVASPYKRDTGVQGGDVNFGVIVPSAYPTALAYTLGVTDMAAVQATLNSGAYYMAQSYPIEEYADGDGIITAFITSEAAHPYRVGGAGGTTFTHVFGVLVDGVVQIPGTDFTESNGAAGEVPATPVTITFAVAPAIGAKVRFCYFTATAHALPQALNTSTAVKPAAVRGRDITIVLGAPGGAQTLLAGVQSVQLNASMQSTITREMGQADPVGRSVQGTDTNGTLTLEPKDAPAYFAAIAQMTGVDPSEVVGYSSQEPVPLQIVIHDPKNPGTVIKSIYVDDATFQPPAADARVATATQVQVSWESLNGTFREIKGRAAQAGD